MRFAGEERDLLASPWPPLLPAPQAHTHRGLPRTPHPPGANEGVGTALPAPGDTFGKRLVFCLVCGCCPGDPGSSCAQRSGPHHGDFTAHERSRASVPIEQQRRARRGSGWVITRSPLGGLRSVPVQTPACSSHCVRKLPPGVTQPGLLDPRAAHACHLLATGRRSLAGSGLPRFPSAHPEWTRPWAGPARLGAKEELALVTPS